MIRTLRNGGTMTTEKLRSFLLRPLLPADTRLRLRQQRYDEEAANKSHWILTTPDLAVTCAVSVDGRGSGENVGAASRLPPSKPWRQGYRYPCQVSWNGQKVGVTGWRGTVTQFVQWSPEPGGLREGFDPADVARAGVRPTTSGECPSRIAAIAAVGLAGHHVSRVYFLDAESRDLGWIPAPGLTEDNLVQVAEAAGIAYRRYVLTLAKFSSLRVMPDGLCEILFPRSARRVRLAEEGDDWYSEYPGSRRW